MNHRISYGFLQYSYRIFLYDLKSKRAHLNAARQFIDDHIGRSPYLFDQWTTNCLRLPHKVWLGAMLDLGPRIMVDANGSLASKKSAGVLCKKQYGSTNRLEHAVMTPLGEPNMK